MRRLGNRVCAAAGTHSLSDHRQSLPDSVYGFILVYMEQCQQPAGKTMGCDRLFNHRLCASSKVCWPNHFLGHRFVLVDCYGHHAFGV